MAAGNKDPVIWPSLCLGGDFELAQVLRLEPPAEIFHGHADKIPGVLPKQPPPPRGSLGEAPPETFQGPRVPAPWRMGNYLADIHPKFLRIPGTSAGRVPSLVVELFFSSLAGLGSYQLSQDPKNVWLFLAATSGTLAGVMALRSYYYGKVMPVGLIAGASWAILPSPLHSFLGEGPSTQLFHLQRQVQPSQF
uniref:Uncharacterized protein n=1 Tax=Callithrix jacchus TaxID=9483 RepID=A0A8I3WIB5_CALJA